MKWLTFIFIVILILIVVAANLGLGHSIFSIIYLIPWGDKVGHFFLMGFLSYLINSVLLASKVRVFSVDLLKGNLCVMAIVTIEEFSQLFLKYRGFSLVDLLFDYIGIIIFGYFAAFRVNRNYQPEKLDNSDY